MAPQAAAAASTNPYLQSMYAAALQQSSNPYAIQGQTGLISLAQNPFAAAGVTATGSTGNPLLDQYAQYAQALAAQGVYTTSAATPGLSTTIDATASKSLLVQIAKLAPSITKEQKRNENGIRSFRFSFFYTIEILTFVNSKSSTLKSGAKGLNVKTKF